MIPDVTSSYIDPTDIYSSYGYDYAALQRQGHCCNPTHDSGGSTPTSSIAIATAYAFAGSDITGFQSRYSYLAYYYNSVYIDGTPSCCNDETTLDTEWAIATANSFGSYLDTSHVWVYEGANNLLSTFTDVYNHMLSDGHARSFSTSWGCAEFSCWDSGTMDTDHAIFNAMLGQGWTLAAASGEQGAAGGCGNADRVIYPASDPDFIAVGGTTLFPSIPMAPSSPKTRGRAAHRVARAPATMEAPEVAAVPSSPHPVTRRARSADLEAAAFLTSLSTRVLDRTSTSTAVGMASVEPALQLQWWLASLHRKMPTCWLSAWVALP